MCARLGYSEEEKKGLKEDLNAKSPEEQWEHLVWLRDAVSEQEAKALQELQARALPAPPFPPRTPPKTNAFATSDG